MSDNLELYQRLGFEDNKPSAEQIKKRYRKLVQECHPDKFPGDEAKTEQFRSVQEAYDILSCPKKRDDYDKTGLINDTNAEDKIKQTAVLMLINLFNMLLDTVPEQLLDTDDVRNPMFANINENIRTHNRSIETNKAILRKIKKMQAKFKMVDTSAGSDILQTAMVERRGAVNAEIKNLKNIVKVLNTMTELLKNYSYDFTKPEMEMVRITFNNSNSGNRVVF